MVLPLFSFWMANSSYCNVEFGCSFYNLLSLCFGLRVLKFLFYFHLLLVLDGMDWRVFGWFGGAIWDLVVWLDEVFYFL